MRVSKLIEKLQASLDEYGDVDVYVSTWEPSRYQRSEMLKTAWSGTVTKNGRVVPAVIVRD